MENSDDQIESSVKTKTQISIPWIRIWFFVCLVAFVIIFVSIEHSMIAKELEKFLAWVEDAKFLGILIFLAVFIVAIVLFIPALILTLGAGYVFTRVYGQLIGIGIGTCVVMLGATLGSIIAFLLGRYAFRDWIQAKIQRYPRFVAIESAIEQEGLKLTFLLRLSPLIPLNAFNYFMGITSVSFRSYALASLGMIPGAVTYVYFGSTLHSISQVATGSFEGGYLQLSLIILSSLFAICAVWYVSYVAKRKIDEIMKQQKKLSKDEISLNKNNEEMGNEQLVPNQIEKVQKSERKQDK